MHQEESLRCHILELPLELLEAVAERCYVQDFLSFRATCREMAAVTLRTFKLRHFFDRAFLLSNRESMEVLGEISKHEVFGKSLKIIRFSLAVIPRTWDYLTKEWDEPCTRGQRAEWRALRKAYGRLKSAEHQFQSGPDLEVLVEILNNFKAANNTPYLAAVDQEINDWSSAKGIRKIGKALGERYFWSRGKGDSHPHDTILNAIAATEFPATSLLLGYICCGASIKMFKQLDFNIMAKNLLQLRIVFQGRDNVYGYGWEAAERHVADAKHFFDFLSVCENLQHFGLCLSGRVIESTIHDELLLQLWCEEELQQRFTCLRQLKLLEFENHIVPRMALYFFIAIRHETLQTIILKNIKEDEESEQPVEDFLEDIWQVSGGYEKPELVFSYRDVYGENAGTLISPERDPSWPLPVKCETLSK